MLLLSFVYLLKLGRISDDKHALIKIYLELCHYIIYICIYYEGCDLRNNNRIGVVMVSVLISNGVDRGFVHRSDQTKDYNTGFCCSQEAPLRHQEERAKPGWFRNRKMCPNGVTCLQRSAISLGQHYKNLTKVGWSSIKRTS